MPKPPDHDKATKTPEEARAALDAMGVSVQEFAKAHGLHPSTVYEVLAGRRKGRRGEAHRAAVLLGIKSSGSHTKHCCSEEKQEDETPRP